MNRAYECVGAQAPGHIYGVRVRFAQGEKERAMDKEELIRRDGAHVSCGLEAGAVVWWGDQGGLRAGKTQRWSSGG